MHSSHSSPATIKFRRAETAQPWQDHGNLEVHCWPSWQSKVLIPGSVFLVSGPLWPWHWSFQEDLLCVSSFAVTAEVDIAEYFFHWCLSLGFNNKIPWTGWFEQHTFTSHISGGWCVQDGSAKMVSFWWEPFLAYRWPHFSCVLTW